MGDEVEQFAVGDRIVWWSHPHDDRGLAPDHPDARRRSGVVDAVLRSRVDDAVIGYSVRRRSALAGTWLTTVILGRGHRPTRDDSDGAAQ